MLVHHRAHGSSTGCGSGRTKPWLVRPVWPTTVPPMCNPAPLAALHHPNPPHVRYEDTFCCLRLPNFESLVACYGTPFGVLPRWATWRSSPPCTPWRWWAGPSPSAGTACSCAWRGEANSQATYPILDVFLRLRVQVLSSLMCMRHNRPGPGAAVTQASWERRQVTGPPLCSSMSPPSCVTPARCSRSYLLTGMLGVSVARLCE